MELDEMNLKIKDIIQRKSKSTEETVQNRAEKLKEKQM